ncbi:hypothetical protein ABFS83_13G020700 [Erythranthe nasuta]
MIRNVAKRWRELSGQHGWRNLLNPLDADMQTYLLHYGGMAQVTYDTFNKQQMSRYAGSSRYARNNLFHATGSAKGSPYRYDAVKYIYATASIGGLPQGFMVKSMADNPWMDESNWMGYVAVSTNEGSKALGRRDILVAWRGTVLPVEWMKDADAQLIPATDIMGGGGAAGAKLHQGFHSIYTAKSASSSFNKTSARDQVLSEVKKQLDKHKGEDVSITITGHSLGGALATINATDIAYNGLNKSRPVTAITFAAPQVGDRRYKEVLDSTKDCRVLSVRNAPDIVPRVPGAAAGYKNVGVEYKINSMRAPDTRAPGDPLTGHLLESAYLHTIATARPGKNKRDINLVNKDSDMLKPEFKVPGFWWGEKNGGFVQRNDGSWAMDDHQMDSGDPKGIDD